jgi:hypothetical protein
MRKWESLRIRHINPEERRRKRLVGGGVLPAVINILKPRCIYMTPLA